MKTILTAVCATFVATAATAADQCAAGKTLEDGVLTIATGNPAWFPWVIDDTPESGKGFEAAVAYAVANSMGFSDDAVKWVRTSFDEAIQPGAKNFDINLQQFSITPEREEMVDFSEPYYTSAMAVLTTKKVAEGLESPGIDALKVYQQDRMRKDGEGIESPAIDALKGLIWGVMAGTTGHKMVEEIIAPDNAVLLYTENVDVTQAIQAGQVEASLFDLPTALYLSAAVVEDGVLLAQFPADRSENPDQFGFLMQKGNPLKECVDEALAELKASGRLAEIEAEWLAGATGVPVIE
ncbi:MAG: amino acid ABC transporter substrate-binding protein [Rhodobacterales bacterium]|nr:MAG: amino acid ABC transporter substrate-binding protein [Rhodobacterales bacterium]